MKPSAALQQYRDEIRQIVARHHAANARVFGSVLTGEDRDGSDLDLLVDATAETTLMDLGAMRLELRRLLDIEVDVLTRGGLPESFREQVLKDASPV